MKKNHISAYNELNDTAWDAPFESVVRMFERQVREHPDRFAAAGIRLALTYADLNEYANRVANALIDSGIGREDLIMLLLPRNIMYYAVNLGILKAGAAFLPVSPGYPDERIRYIFENAGCRCLVTTRKLSFDRADLLIDLHKRPLFLENLLTWERAENPGTEIQPDDLAYCIYTSGSTGRPKGVMIEHGNLANFLQPGPKNYEVTTIMEKGSVLLANAALTFDFSLMEELTGLCGGLTVVMASDAETLNPLLLSRLMDQYGVDAMCCTPSYLNTLLAARALRPALERIRVYDLGAEAFPGELFGEIRAASPEAVIINGYGPTETTISCIAKEITSGEGITIGRPAANVCCYIIGKDGEVLPPGETGELLICGKGVGRGYRNPEALKENPFIKFNGMRAYRSGDLARLNPDGEIEFHGRTDHQIKIKGLRIELGEIEEVMSGCPVISLCAVTPIENRYLCLYYTLREDVAPGNADEAVRSFAKEHLAHYMVPDWYMRLDRMPFTANRKIDRKNLPKPEIHEMEGLAPETDMQKYILECIRSTRSDRSPGTDTDLTLEGLSSLDWMLVIAAVGEKYGVSLNIADISRCKTVLGLEKYILDMPERQADEAVREARAADVQAVYYYLQQFSGLDENRMTVQLRMDRTVNIGAVEDAVRRAAAMHPGLFARYEKRKDGLYILAPESAADAAREMPVDILRAAEAEMPEICRRFAAEPLLSDDETGFRFAVCETEESKILLACFSHTLGDGTSVSILLDDILRALDGREIEAEEINIFQANRENDQVMESVHRGRIENYLKAYYEKLVGKADWPDLLTDPCNAFHPSEYGMKTLSLSEEECNELCRKLNVSETVFFAGLTILSLAGRSGGRRVPLLLASNGRFDNRLKNTFGFLVRPVILCPDADPGISAAAFFRETARQYFDGLCLQGFPLKEMQARYPGWMDHLFIYQASDTDHTLFGKDVKEQWIAYEEDVSAEEGIPETDSGNLQEQTAVRWACRQMTYEVYAEDGEITYLVGAPSGFVREGTQQEIAEDVDRMCSMLHSNQNMLLGGLLK